MHFIRRCIVISFWTLLALLPGILALRQVSVVTVCGAWWCIDLLWILSDRQLRPRFDHLSYRYFAALWFGITAWLAAAVGIGVLGTLAWPFWLFNPYALAAVFVGALLGFCCGHKILLLPPQQSPLKAAGYGVLGGFLALLAIDWGLFTLILLFFDNCGFHGSSGVSCTGILNSFGGWQGFLKSLALFTGISLTVGGWAAPILGSLSSWLLYVLHQKRLAKSFNGK
jgi:hypothetical protein